MSELVLIRKINGLPILIESITSINWLQFIFRTALATYYQRDKYAPPLTQR